MYEVVRDYHTTNSIEKTAMNLNLSAEKVRKILITMSEYSSALSIKINALRGEGKTVDEIAAILGIKNKRVNSYLPYEKVIYNLSDLSGQAKRSKTYRKRMKTAQDRFITKDKNATNSHGGQNKGEGNETMKDNIITLVINRENGADHTGFKPIRLRLELKKEFFDKEEQRLLKRYGGSSTGKTIRRDILIPSDMHLHHLHYAIQKLFGWQNSHLRCFELPEDIYRKLTGGTVRGFAKLAGVLFQYFDAETEDAFWDDDYRRGSINTWLKKKYTGPYRYGGTAEAYDEAQNAMDHLLNRHSVIDMTLEEMQSKIIFDEGLCNLLERLPVCDILAQEGDKITGLKAIEKNINDPSWRRNGEIGPKIEPVAKSLLYRYDFGDNWEITITRPDDSCKDLIDEALISEMELDHGVETVLSSHKPVCIHRDGMNVVDDVGGLSGFASFLGSVYESEDKKEKEESLTWAKSMGWSTRTVDLKNVL